MERFYDEVLEFEMLGGWERLMYADDLARVAADLGIELLKLKVEVSITEIGLWIDGSRLKLVPEKTGAIIFHTGHSQSSHMHGQVEIIPLRRRRREPRDLWRLLSRC